MKCTYGEATGVKDCVTCLHVKTCEVHHIVTLIVENTIINCDTGKRTLNLESECLLGKAKVSSNFQIALIKEVRPWLSVRPGHSIAFKKLCNGMVIIELSKDDVKGGEQDGKEKGKHKEKGKQGQGRTRAGRWRSHGRRHDKRI